MALPAPAAQSTCLITGASSGIGVELARSLAKRGYGVVLVARRKERLEELADQLSAAHHIRAEAIAADLGEESVREQLASDVEALGLTVDMLCNNAGFGIGQRFVALDRERQLQMLRVNCEALVDLCSRYAPAMVLRGRGAILNVASTTAFQPIPGQATYAASKALVLSFTESLHQELASKGVTVTALCPGPVRTEFVESAGIEGADDTPAFLWDTAEEVAEAAIRGLERNKRVVVPGAINRAGAITGQHTPHGLLLRAMDRFYPVGRER